MCGGKLWHNTGTLTFPVPRRLHRCYFQCDCSHHSVMQVAILLLFIEKRSSGDTAYHGITFPRFTMASVSHGLTVLNKLNKATKQGALWKTSGAGGVFWGETAQHYMWCKKHQHQYIILTLKYGGGNVMIWSCLAASGPKPLAIMEGNINFQPSQIS